MSSRLSTGDWGGIVCMVLGAVALVAVAVFSRPVVGPVPPLPPAMSRPQFPLAP